MSEGSYKWVPFSSTLRGFRTLGHYSNQEYRAFAKQLKKRLDEYFLDDCYFIVSTKIGPNAVVKVTTSKNGNTYEITPIGDWDGYTERNTYTSSEEYEYYVLIDILRDLSEDIDCMKESVSKILNAVKNNQPLDEGEGNEEDAFEEIRRRVLGCGK